MPAGTGSQRRRRKGFRTHAPRGRRRTRRAESESEDRASRKPLDQAGPHGLQGPGSSRRRQLQPRLGTRKTREEGSGGRGWRGALPRPKTQEETAGSKSRKGRAAVGTQAGAGPGLSCPRAPSRRVGRRLVGAGGCTPCAARAAPRGRGCSCRWGPSLAPPPPSPPRWQLWPNHAFRLSCARRPPLALWSFQSQKGGAGDPDARRM